MSASTVLSVVRQTRTDLGAVMTYIVSPTRTVLVKDTAKTNPRFKLPGGSIEPSDAGKVENDEFGVIAGAIREVKEETGIELSSTEVKWWYGDSGRGTREYYLPHFCVAEVSEEKLDTHTKTGDEDGIEIVVKTFDRAEIAELDEDVVLWKHLRLIRDAEEKLN